jgi:hypothetical protein
MQQIYPTAGLRHFSFVFYNVIEKKDAPLRRVNCGASKEK